ncbi:PREDICTED: uclacyanin-3-like [Populus euphratica]|uniref:Uclacyanin-3-like n=1 Tax=Populus euphratica TaxID=75702 RepID=A0AAJ6U002_POPEU|nr:PREDICTED: uclacyanin-3-like [Populus euphratica]
MARGLNIAFLAAIAIAALIQTSVAQTTHTVGDTTGWAIPTGDPAFYSSWAANQTFNIGEILVFNFMANAHDVAKVTKADYDACTTSSPISSVETSPARINLDASGEHYFICNFTGHCSAGQKMMINVSAASSSPSPAPQRSSSAPQPSTPTPQSSPSPQPSTPTPQSSSAPQPSTPAPRPSTPAPQPSTPAPQPSTPAPRPSTPAPQPSTPAPQPSTPTPASGPSAPAPTPASGSPPSPPTAQPPSTVAPPNSARSLGFSGFTTFLSIFVVFWCYYITRG